MVVPTATIMLAHGVSVRCMDAETGLRAKDAALRMLRAAIERNYCAYSDLGNDPSSETASARWNQVCQRLVLASVHQGALNCDGPFFVATVCGCRVDTIWENAGCSQKKEGHTVMCPFPCHFLVCN